jgi:hypothetical protein
LDKHEEPFKSITKSVTDISLAIIEGSLEDFRDIIKVLPHKMEISMPGRPKRFIPIGISIAAMAMSTFNTVRITQLNEEIRHSKRKWTSSWTWFTSMKSTYTTWRKNWTRQTNHWLISWKSTSGFHPKSQMPFKRNSNPWSGITKT